MLRFNKTYSGDQELSGHLTLTFDQRVKSRHKVNLDDGREAGLFLPRGGVLQEGQRIQAESGEVVEIRAAPESVSTLYVKDPVQMARICYHLGNRHVALQIEDGFVRYQQVGCALARRPQVSAVRPRAVHTSAGRAKLCIHEAGDRVPSSLRRGM